MKTIRSKTPSTAALAFAMVASLTASAFADDYKFQGGYPTPPTVQKAYDEADLNRTIQAYRFFYPPVAAGVGQRDPAGNRPARGPA